MENSEMSPATPAHATEAPSIGKVWRQLKSNSPTFAILWGFNIVVAFLNINVDFTGDDTSLNFTLVDWVLLVPQTILPLLARVSMVAVPAIYYATDHCPAPDEIFSILLRNLKRYLLAELLFNIAAIVGILLYVIPGILVILSNPLYIHYVSTTNLNLTTCLSKAVKTTFQNFGGFFVVSLLCSFAIGVSVIACIFPVLAVWPMTQLYLQNYIHYKGMVRARTLA